MEVFINSGELFLLPVALACSLTCLNTFSGEYFVSLKIILYHQVAYIHGLMMTLIMDSIAIPAEDSVNIRALQHGRAMVQ